MTKRKQKSTNQTNEENVKKTLKPKNDVVFQRLFNKDNQKITKAFAEAMLDEKIHHMTINEDKELLSDTLDKKMETIWQIVEKNHPKTILTNKFEIHILELEKVKEEYKKNKDNKKAQWLLFLDDPETEEVKEIMEKNEDVKEAVIEVRKLSQDEQLQREAELREKAIMDEKAIYQAGLDNGKEEGEKLGRKKGRVETMKEVAKKLLKQNMNIENVAEITGLTIEDIEKLKEE